MTGWGTRPTISSMATLHHLLPEGVTVKVAAETLGISTDHMSRILNCKVEPSWKLAMEIHKHFPRIERWMLKPELWEQG